MQRCPMHLHRYATKDVYKRQVDEQRIKAGLPDNIEVTQKIGSFSNITQSDCGIVYVPNRRYILCVMLDEEADKANQHIKVLSKKVYDYVSKVN